MSHKTPTYPAARKRGHIGGYHREPRQPKLPGDGVPEIGLAVDTRP